MVGNLSSVGSVLSEGKVPGYLDGSAIGSGAMLGSRVGITLRARLGTTLG